MDALHATVDDLLEKASTASVDTKETDGFALFPHSLFR